MIELRLLKRGTLFTKRAIDEPHDTQVWIKDYYDPSTRKYCCYRFSDVNDYQFISGNKLVFTDFTF